MHPTLTFSSELRPRDFAARFRRAQTRGLGAARRAKHRGRRAIVLLAAVALPAFAMPSDWHDFAIGNAGAADAHIRPMPFEQPGQSFPGSAFYYLSAEPTAPLLGGQVHSDADDAPTAIDPLTGPAARAMRIDNSGVDRTRALQCLTAAIYYEAASEADAGQRAVAQVVLNRVAHPAYPNTVCGVVYQGSERSTGCQFSFTCDGSLARVPSRMFWLRAEQVAREALSGSVYAGVGLATHYHTVSVHPYWADSLNYLGTIGAHRFYRFKGPAGAPATFRFAYLGGEPIAAPHPRDRSGAAPTEPVIDPLAVQRAYEAGLKTAQAGVPGSAKLAPSPVYATELERRGGDAIYRADRLPGSTGINPEYAESGRWIAQPGT